MNDETEDRDDITPADYLVAVVLVDKAGRFIREMAAVADENGTSINLGQVIGAMLGVSLGMVDKPMTREQFVNVYDVYERQFTEALTTAQDMGTGPEATADAPSREAAGARAEHWGGVIDTAAFDISYSPEQLADWERELLGGSEPADG